MAKPMIIAMHSLPINNAPLLRLTMMTNIGKLNMNNGASRAVFRYGLALELTRFASKTLIENGFEQECSCLANKKEWVR